MQSKRSIRIPWKVFSATVHWCTLHCLGHLLLQTILLSAYDDWCHPPSVFLCPASLVWFVVEHTPALFQLVLNLPFLTSQSHPATNLSFESNPAIFFTHTHTHTCIHVYVHTHTHTHMYTRVCTHTHTHTHTHIYIYIYIYKLFVHISSSLIYSLLVKVIKCCVLSYTPFILHPTTLH